MFRFNRESENPVCFFIESEVNLLLKQLDNCETISLKFLIESQSIALLYEEDSMSCLKYFFEENIELKKTSHFSPSYMECQRAPQINIFMEKSLKKSKKVQLLKVYSINKNVLFKDNINGYFLSVFLKIPFNSK